LRLATTGAPEARSEVVKTLEGMALLMDVTATPGLLARWVSRGPLDPRGHWRPSAALSGYWWEGDVSKDQLAGYACGLGVPRALLPERARRERASRLALPLAARLRRDRLRIIDANGERTTFGDLRAHIALVPIGVNALIALAVAEAAGAASGDGSFAAELADARYFDAAQAPSRHAPLP